MNRRRFLLLLLIAAAAAAALAWRGSPWVVERGRSWLQRRLAERLGTPSRIGALRVTLVPPTVTLEDVAVAEGGAALRLGRAMARLVLVTSLRQLRPVVEVEVDGIDVDPTRFPQAPGGEPTELVLPPFELRRLQINGGRAKVPVGDDGITVSVERLVGAAEVRASTRRLSARIEIEQVRFERRGETLPLDRVRVDAEQGEHGWVISRLDAQGTDVTVTVSGEDRAPPRHTVAVDVPIDRLRLLEKRLAPVAGRLRVAGLVTGSLAEPEGQVTVAATGVRIAGRAVGDLRGDLEIHGPRIRLVAGRLDGFDGQLTFGGEVTLAGDVPCELNAEWKDVLIGPALPPATARAVAPAVTHGHIGVLGALNPPSLQVHADGEFAAARGRQFVPVTCTVSGGYQDSSGRAEISARQGTANQLRADLAVAPSGELIGSIRAEITDASGARALVLGVPVPSIRGSLAMSAEIDGTLAQPRVTGNLQGRKVDWLGAMVDQFDATFAANRQTVRIEDFLLAIGGGRVHAGGTFALTGSGDNDWEASVQDLSTNAVVTVVEGVSGVHLPLWSGALSAEIAGRGAWTRMSLRGNASLENAYLFGEPFAAVSLAVDANWPQWNAEMDVLHLPTERLDATLSGSGVEWVQASVRSSEWRLDRLRGASSLGLQGTATVSADVKGLVSQLDGRLVLGLGGLEWRERTLGDVTLSAEGVKGSWQFAGTAGERIGLNGNVTTREPYPVRVRLEWDQADLAPFLTREIDVRIESTGAVELRGSLVAVSALDGDLLIPSLSIVHGEERLAATAPIRVRGRKGRFAIEPLSLAGKSAEISAEGELNASGQIDVRLRAACDLGWLEALFSSVESARGHAAVDVTVQRSATGQLRLAGTGSIADGGLDLGLPVALTGVNGRCSLAGSAIRIDELTGQTAGGTFDVGGSIDLSSGPALTWAVREISPAVLPDMENELSGQGSVGGGWDDLIIAGDIEVHRLLYEKRIRLTDLIPRFQRELGPARATEGTGRKIRLDLHVTARDEIFIDTNVAKAELRADLRVGGTVGQVTLAGPIEMLNAEVTLQNRKYTIESGVIEFKPALGLNPALNITANSVVDTPGATYTVGVQVVGTAEKYQVLLSSDDPSLSESDLASLASFGKTSAQLQQGGGGVSVNDLIALAPGLYRDEIEEGVREVLPIDRVQFESAYSRTTGSYEPRVTVSKDLTDRLSALASTTFGVENRRGVYLEYRLSPRVSVSGMWESETTAESGAFGGAVKFRYAFHRPRLSLLMPWRGWFDGELW